MSYIEVQCISGYVPDRIRRQLQVLAGQRGWGDPRIVTTINPPSAHTNAVANMVNITVAEFGEVDDHTMAELARKRANVPPGRSFFVCQLLESPQRGSRLYEAVDDHGEMRLVERG